MPAATLRNDPTTRRNLTSWQAIFCMAAVLAAGCAAQPSGNAWTPNGYTLPGTMTGADGSTLTSGDTTAKSDSKASDAAAALDSGAPDQVAEVADDSPDMDSDGYTVNGGDCDDFNTAVHPKAAELCNDRDDNCNGQVDDVDLDGDGFSQCPGNAQDCDDTDPAVHPGAVVACEPEKDGNCDGLPDMDEDFDFDGHPLCEDCDDKNPDVYPGAAPDCTGKIKDANCDGTPDIGLDQDKDGYSSCNDCDDSDPAVHLYALESCNGKDDDCNGVIDDLDYDGDGYPACKIPNFELDCSDKDLTINPGALRNCKNGKDNDCSGVIDANEDGDGDGVVGCQDCNDYNKSISPKSLETLGDNIDNDCDGQTDESPASCDVATLDTTKPADYAKSLGLCSGVVSSTFPTAAASNSHAILKSYGIKNVPNGATFVVMSSGVAAAKNQPGYAGVSSSFSNSAPYPNVNCKNSSSVYDYTELKLVINVPANAKAFSFDFNFMSHEYPVYVGSSYNDKFLAVLDSTAFKGNVSFDSKGNCISINNALFQECDANASNKKSTCNLGPSGLVGTGYDDVGGGGTGWLTTTSPVTPGEQITLRFIVFDEGDHILDSVAIIDNFRWLAGSTSTTPSTIRPGS